MDLKEATQNAKSIAHSASWRPPKGSIAINPNLGLPSFSEGISFDRMKQPRLATSGRVAGVGLLLLRLVLAGELLFTGLCACSSHDLGWLKGACTIASVFLIAGLLTSAFATISALLSAATLISCHVGPERQFAIVAALVSMAVALLGGGVLSLDARLFGRKRVVFPPSRDNDR